MILTDTSAINQWDAKQSKMIDELTKGRDDLREERDQLRIHSSNLTQEMEVLKNNYNSMVASRDKLQLELESLKRNDTGEKLTHV